MKPLKLLSVACGIIGSFVLLGTAGGVEMNTMSMNEVVFFLVIGLCYIGASILFVAMQMDLDAPVEEPSDVYISDYPVTKS